MTEEQLQQKIRETVSYYVQMRESQPTSSILREVRWQYADMAEGGDGGDLGFVEIENKTCRAENYPGYPDRFFQDVRDLMGWK
jgi:hypothetical protein